MIACPYGPLLAESAPRTNPTGAMVFAAIRRSTADSDLTPRLGRTHTRTHNLVPLRRQILRCRVAVELERRIAPEMLRLIIMTG